MDLELQEDSFIKIHSDHRVVKNLVLELDNRPNQVWIKLFPTANIPELLFAFVLESSTVTLNVINRDSGGASLSELIAVGRLVLFSHSSALLSTAK